MQFEFDGENGVIRDKVTGKMRCYHPSQNAIDFFQDFLKSLNQVQKSSFSRQTKQQAKEKNKERDGFETIAGVKTVLLPFYRFLSACYKEMWFW